MVWLLPWCLDSYFYVCSIFFSHCGSKYKFSYFVQNGLCYEYLFSLLYLEEQLYVSSNMAFAVSLVLKEQQQ